MIVLKGMNSYRLESDYYAVDAMIEQVTMPMPNLEFLARFVAVVRFHAGYAVRLFAATVEPSGMALVHDGDVRWAIYALERAPQGALKATAYSLRMMRNQLDGVVERLYLKWVDNVVLWG